MKVAVIIITHLDENDEILQNCLKSFTNSVGIDMRAIVVSSRFNDPVLPDNCILVKVPRDVNTQEVFEIGVKHAPEDTTHYMFCNDDLIFSKYAIAMMASFVGNNDLIMNPVSNCDSGWIHHCEFNLINKDGVKLPSKRFYSLEELRGYEEAIMNYPMGYQVAIQTKFLCMYATMISKRVYEKIGPLDANYVLGFSDADYSIRAAKLGIACMVHTGAFVMHMGGASTNKTLASRDQSKNIAYFDSKHGEGAHKQYI